MKIAESATLAGDPYTRSTSYQNFYANKVSILGELVVVLRGQMPDRGMLLIPQRSRAVRAGDVHELVASTEPGLGPSSRVNAVAYLGFVEMSRGGVLLAGDQLWIGDRLIGSIAGFDDTHMPNHMNIVISCAELKSGVDLHLSLGSPVKFVMTNGNP
jgi:hypothetical protein